MLGNHGRFIAKAIFHQPARGLARLGVTPNMVTTCGTFLTVIFSITLLARGHLIVGPWVLGLVLFADSLDGSLARITGKSTAFGAFLDSTLDRVADGAVFGSLLAWTIFGMAPSLPRTIAIIAGIVALIGVGTVPYARARAESIGVDATKGFAERTDRLVVSLLGAELTGVGLSDWPLGIALVIVALATMATVIQRILAVARQIGNKPL